VQITLRSKQDFAALSAIETGMKIAVVYRERMQQDGQGTV
jgi:hypothetical protein